MISCDRFETFFSRANINSSEPKFNSTYCIQMSLVQADFQDRSCMADGEIKV